MLNDLLLGSATAALQKPLLESRLGAAVIGGGFSLSLQQARVRARVRVRLRVRVRVRVSC